jgi:hypothetical protein
LAKVNEASSNLTEKRIAFITTETKHKDCDFILCIEETKLKEWEMLCENIKKLRKELKVAGNEEEKVELNNDIEGLLNCKNNWAKILGLK